MCSIFFSNTPIFAFRGHGTNLAVSSFLDNEPIYSLKFDHKIHSLEVRLEFSHHDHVLHDLVGLRLVMTLFYSQLEFVLLVAQNLAPWNVISWDGDLGNKIQSRLVQGQHVSMFCLSFHKCLYSIMSNALSTIDCLLHVLLAIKCLENCMIPCVLSEGIIVQYTQGIYTFLSSIFINACPPCLSLHLNVMVSW